MTELSAQLGEGKEGPAARHPQLRLAGMPGARRRGDRLGEQAHRRAAGTRGHLRRGVGVACSMQGSGIAGVDWASAFLKLNEDGSFNLQVGAVRPGDGSGHGAGADRRGNAGRDASTRSIVTSGDTDFTPFDVGAYASSTTIISGGAVKKAAEKVRDAGAGARVQDAGCAGG